MRESFPSGHGSVELEPRKKELNGIPYEIDPDDGSYRFDDINIGGEVKGEDFRDFIVNRERVGVRTDSTLWLPKETKMSPGDKDEILFTLPRSKQNGRIFKDGAATYATPL